MLVWTSILYLGWTMVSIPYSAWGAELTPDYHERTRLTGAREVFQLLGLLIATSIPALLAQQAGGKLGPTLRVLCEMTVVLLPLAALLLLVMVREAPVTPAPHLPWAKSLSIAWRNAPFRRLLFASVIGSLASSVNLSLAVLFYGHAMHLQNEANTLIFFYIVIGVLAAPFWLLLARKVSKHRLICIAGLWGCFWFCTVPFLPPGEFWPMMIVNLLSGLNVAVAPILFPSMAADAVDLDRLRSRKQRAALFFGLWAMGAKLATAVGVGVALPLLALAGFNAQGVNGPEQIFWLKVLYVALPVALWLVTIAMLWTYPITPERQARFRARIERRYGTALPPAPTI
jgi:Na+/melibiose symporter-like transporter